MRFFSLLSCVNRVGFGSAFHRCCFSLHRRFRSFGATLLMVGMREQINRCLRTKIKSYYCSPVTSHKQTKLRSRSQSRFSATQAKFAQRALKFVRILQSPTWAEKQSAASFPPLASFPLFPPKPRNSASHSNLSWLLGARPELKMAVHRLACHF